jgi:pimeloyl-ACP methyl ester carboxylesterase
MRFTLEPLDRRLLLAAAPHGGVDMAHALDLGALSGVKIASDTMLADQASGYFKFALKSRGNFTVSVYGMTADLNLELQDSRGVAIASSARPGTAYDLITQDLAAGVYYARVVPAAGGVETGFSLRTQADLNWTSIVQNGKRRSIGVIFADGEAHPIRNNLQTWVICHGWTSSPDSLSDVSAAVKAAEPASQVLALDWSSVAAGDLMTALSGVKPVAAAAAAVLKRWGIAGSRINLIGHSFGGFMIDRIAAGISGGVNRMVAIDPADDVITGVNYAARSRFSLGFIASTMSTPAHALTADETFKIDFGSLGDLFSHVGAPSLYAAMVQANADGSPDNVSRLFALNRLSATFAQPWKRGSGYEGTIKGTGDIVGGWAPASITYKSAKTAKSVTVKA